MTTALLALLREQKLSICAVLCPLTPRSSSPPLAPIPRSVDALYRLSGARAWEVRESGSEIYPKLSKASSCVCLCAVSESAQREEKRERDPNNNNHNDSTPATKKRRARR